MNPQDFFATLKDTLIAKWEEFQESPVYSQIKERYESLSPVGQKAILFTGLFLILFMLYMIPHAFISSGDDAIAIYEEKKEQAQELLEVTQTSKTLPPLPPRLDSAQLKGAVTARLQEAGLTAEQIKNVIERTSPAPTNGVVPSSVLQSIVDVELAQLNLKQMVDIEFAFSKISPLVKVVSLEMNAFPSDNHYYNVKYAVASFNVKETEKDTDAKGEGTKKSVKPKTKPAEKEDEE